MGLFGYSPSEEKLRTALEPVAEACARSVVATGSVDDAADVIAVHAASLQEAWRRLEAEGGRQSADKKFIGMFANVLGYMSHRVMGRNV